MPQWLLEQWNDIKGNFKWFVVVLILSFMTAAAIALTHGLLLWQQITLAIIFVLMFAWALFMTADRYYSARLPLLAAQRPPSSSVNLQSMAEIEKEAASLLKSAPQLLIRYTSRDMGKVTYLNDGPGAIVNPQLGPLKWAESRTIGIIGNVGTLPAGGQSEHVMLFEISPNCGGELYDFMRRSTPPDAETTVTATYEDARGHKFARDFTLTTQVDGTVTWQPGDVRAPS